MKKDITPKNKQGRGHGWWERYHSNGQLFFKGNYINGIRDGWWEYYWRSGELSHRGNFINGKYDGGWIWDKYKVISFYV